MRKPFEFTHLEEKREDTRNKSTRTHSNEQLYLPSQTATRLEQEYSKSIYSCLSQ